MNILLISATKLEIEPFVNQIIEKGAVYEDDKTIHYKNLKIDMLITGLGLVFTAYRLTKEINNKKYELVINAGIAGSYNQDLNIGDVVFVETEEFGDLGIEDSDGFKTIFEKKFIKINEFPFTDGILRCSLLEKLKNIELKRVRAISSNTSHGKEITINYIRKKFNPDIETMEGAAFFYVCLMEKVNFVGIMAISNYVEIRDTSKWNIPLAIKNLSNKLFQIINTL